MYLILFLICAVIGQILYFIISTSLFGNESFEIEIYVQKCIYYLCGTLVLYVAQKLGFFGGKLIPKNRLE